MAAHLAGRHSGFLTSHLFLFMLMFVRSLNRRGRGLIAALPVRVAMHWRTCPSAHGPFQVRRDVFDRSASHGLCCCVSCCATLPRFPILVSLPYTVILMIVGLCLAGAEYGSGSANAHGRVPSSVGCFASPVCVPSATDTNLLGMLGSSSDIYAYALTPPVSLLCCCLLSHPACVSPARFTPRSCLPSSSPLSSLRVHFPSTSISFPAKSGKPW